MTRTTVGIGCAKLPHALDHQGPVPLFSQVAVARLAGADLFVTCDQQQHELAEATGLYSSWVH